jgi:PilZ domain
MDEHRTSPRRRVLKSGQIAFSDKVPKLECMVRNVSDTGACVQISTTVGMPTSFGLLIDGVRHNCRVVWRTDTRLGVAFM